MQIAHVKWPQVHPEEIKKFLQQENRVTTLNKVDAWEKSLWPKGPGVYLIWQCFMDSRKLLYIGKTGKFTRAGQTEIKMNRGNLADKLLRYTPYCFAQDEENNCTFLYGPKAAGDQILEFKEKKDRYKYRVDADDIEVECFSLKDYEYNLSPALLEALFLQYYLSENNDLPVANNEF